LKEDILSIKREMEMLKELLNEMLESPEKDNDKILEISHKLDHYILKYYKDTLTDND